MCPTCASPVPDGSSFCSNCGSLIVETSSDQSAVVQTSSNRGRLVAVGAAILVVGVGLGLTALGGGDDGGEASEVTKAPPTVAPVAAGDPVTTEPEDKPTTTTSTVPAQDPVDVGLMAVGDCLELPAEDIFYEFTPVDCDLPHDLEVFAIVDLSELSEDYSLKALYPGDADLSDFAFDVCLDEFDAYVGVPYADSVIYIDVFHPTEEGWTLQDDREIDCVLYSVDLNTNLRKTTGSLRNAGI